MENKERDTLLKEVQEKVDKMKKFYSHLTIYIFVNAMIIFVNYTNSRDEGSIFQWKYFSTAIFWGIGLAAHGLNVFSSDLLFGSNWEERKIREIMDRERKRNRDEYV